MISLKDPLHEDAFRLARKLGISLEELYAKAIAEYVQRSKSERYNGITQTLDRIYKTESSELEPALAELQAQTLDNDEW